VTGRTRSPYAPGVGRRSVLSATGLVTALIGGVVLGGCDTDHPAPHPAAAEKVRVSWQEATLPTAPGPAGRLAVRDATYCAGQWYVVGAVLRDDGSSRPAAWSSGDARTWRPMATAPTTYHAQRAILKSVACRDGRIAVVGARSGGAHGNPRTTTWYQRPDGTLVDAPATFELFGGPNALSVNRIEAGPRGWLITGTRSSGGAVWVSRDATGFRLVDDDPALSSDADRTTSALDSVPDATGWTVVGREEVSGRIAPEPLAWTSGDGVHWARQPVPAGTDGFADLERVVRQGDPLVAAGIRGRAFGTWERTGSHWRVVDTFGALDRDGTGAPFVSGLATVSSTVLVTVSDGARFRLWSGTDGAAWHEVVTPTDPPSTGDTQMSIVADDGGTVLLLSDDGTSGRVWTADWNTLGR
jgi:hypothetical protein